MTWFAMRGNISRELLSYRMIVIVHDNPHEMAFLITGGEIVRMKGETPYDVASWLQRRVMLLKDHPSLTHVRWPLKKEDFWDQLPRNMTPQQVRRAAWPSL